MTVMPASGKRELAVVLLVAAVQFVNILDFVMVMPMGPDFASALHIPASRLGLIGGSYTAAASVAGLVSSLFLDRFDRRPALGISMLGLVIGTALGGFATDLTTLMIARMVAGAFGGPATSLRSPSRRCSACRRAWSSRGSSAGALRSWWWRASAS